MPADQALENAHLPDCCACCKKGEMSAIEPTCCGCFTAKRAHTPVSDQLESCQRVKLNAVKMEQELFDNNNKLKELKEAKLLYSSSETLENIRSK